MNEKTINQEAADIIKTAAILLLIQVVLLQWGDADEHSGLMLAGFWQDLSATYIMPIVAFGVMLDRLVKAKRADVKGGVGIDSWARALLYGGRATSFVISFLYALILFGVAVLL